MLIRRNLLTLLACALLGIVIIILGVYIFSSKTNHTALQQSLNITQATITPSPTYIPFTFTDDFGKPVLPGYIIQYGGNKSFSLVGVLKDISSQNNNLFANILIHKNDQDVDLHFLLITPNTLLYLKKTNVTNVNGRQEVSNPQVDTLSGNLTPIISKLEPYKGKQILMQIPLFALSSELANRQGGSVKFIAQEIRNHLDCNTSLFQLFTTNSTILPNCTFYSYYLTMYEKP